MSSRQTMPSGRVTASIRRSVAARGGRARLKTTRVACRAKDAPTRMRNANNPAAARPAAPIFEERPAIFH